MRIAAVSHQLVAQEVKNEATEGQGRFSISFSSVAKRISMIAVPLVLLAALASLPRAEAAGGPGTWSLPVCLAACVAATAASGPWAVATWFACKSACIAIAVAF